MAFSKELLSACWFLAGPTACGKTAASLCLADRIRAEIVAMDSMTLYRGMDIGTAKPTPEERSVVPHHLIDILDPQDEYSLAEYLVAAEAACRDIRSRGRTPLFVGGTGLYLRGLLRGVFEGPSADWELRRRWEEIAQTSGPQALWEQLHVVDPATAGRLHPNDQRRIIRALEVFELTGQRLSTLQTEGARPSTDRPRHVYWISPPRDWLYRRIEQRVDQMFANGLIEEVRQLLSQPEALSHTARQALGYKEMIDWLETHLSPRERTDPLAVEQKSSEIVSEVAPLIQMRTRQFAKRQHTWFRNLVECQPLVIRGHESASDIADAIVRASDVMTSKSSPTDKE